MSSVGVVLGLSPTGLAVVRELGRHGAILFGVDERRFTVGGASKYCRVLDTRGLHDAALCSYLVSRFLGYESRPVVIPTSDFYVEFVARHHKALVEVFELATCYSDGNALSLMNKESLKALCDRHGVPRPKTWTSTQLRRELDSGRSIEFPLVAKPKSIHRWASRLDGKKVIGVNGESELHRLMREVGEIDDFLFQEVVPGPESEIVVCAIHRERKEGVCSSFSARKIHQHPVGFGSAAVVISERVDEVVAESARFLEAIGYEGVCGTEWKRDSRTGRWKLIEVNPRPCLWFGLASASGVDPIYSQFCTLASLLSNSQKYEEHQEDGVRWRFFVRSLAAWWQRQFARFRMGHSQLRLLGDWRDRRRRRARKTVGAIFARDDRAPALTQWRYYAWRLLFRRGGSAED